MCTVLLPLGGNPIAVNKYIIYLRLGLPSVFYFIFFHTKAFIFSLRVPHAQLYPNKMRSGIKDTTCLIM